MNYEEFQILIVDDEPQLRDLFVDILELENFIVIQASSGEEAFEKLERNSKIKLVISDIRMKNGDGFELLRRVNSEIPNPPIVYLISGYSDYSPNEIIAAGAAGLLRKPNDIDKAIEIAINLFSSMSE